MQRRIEARLAHNTDTGRNRLADPGAPGGTVSDHRSQLFAKGELQAAPTIKEFLITAADGKNYRTSHYNLDAIISVGYRVKSAVATRFRTWPRNSSANTSSKALCSTM